ncbi:MAG: glycoside hydrolase family 25 protein [Clostridia bacterium]|nr:glycoside hydrolase family 25 protein [Clostridia bacterium]
MKTNKKTLLITALVVAAAIAAVAVVAVMKRNEPPAEPTTDSPRPVMFGYYDSSDFSVENERKIYSGKDFDTLTGIDVSSFQGDIDWKAVAADGISFAFIRAGFRGSSEGGIFDDDLFEDNAADAAAAGLQVGAYFFSQAVSEDEAREEARFLLDAVEGRDVDLPLVIDFEDISSDSRISGLTNAERTAVVSAFADEIRANGREPMLYTSMYYATEKLYYEQLDLPVWLAAYSGPTEFGYGFTVWQYSSDGSVAGIDGPVDMDLMFVKKPAR